MAGLFGQALVHQTTNLLNLGLNPTGSFFTWETGRVYFDGGWVDKVEKGGDVAAVAVVSDVILDGLVELSETVGAGVLWNQWSLIEVSYYLTICEN